MSGLFRIANLLKVSKKTSLFFNCMDFNSLQTKIEVKYYRNKCYYKRVSIERTLKNSQKSENQRENRTKI